MNLSPQWVTLLHTHGYECVHWSTVGAGNAPDDEIMAWAARNHHVVFTEDLDFSELIALSNASEPSIIQIRSRDNLPDVMGEFVIAGLKQFENDLANGAIIVLDYPKARARILPFKK